MDIYCPKCGEPWNMDELHYVEGKTYTEAKAEFRSKGCEVFDTSHNNLVDKNRGILSGALMDMMPDDLDGVAAMLDDIY